MLITTSFLTLLIVSIPHAVEFVDMRIFRIPVAYLALLIPYFYTMVYFLEYYTIYINVVCKHKFFSVI